MAQRYGHGVEPQDVQDENRHDQPLQGLGLVLFIGCQGRRQPENAKQQQINKEQQAQVIDDQCGRFDLRVGKPGKGREKQQARRWVEIGENRLPQLLLGIAPGIGPVGRFVLVERHIGSEIERGKIDILLVRPLKTIGRQKGDIQEQENQDEGQATFCC